MVRQTLGEHTRRVAHDVPDYLVRQIGLEARALERERMAPRHRKRRDRGVRVWREP